MKQLPAADTVSVVIAPRMTEFLGRAVEELGCARVIEHTALCASARDACVHCAWSSDGFFKHPGKYLWAQHLQLPS